MFFPSRFQNIPIFKNSLQGTSLVVQRWGPHAPIAGNMDAIPDQGSKFSYATQCGQRKQEKEKKNRLHFQRSFRFTTKWEWKMQRFPVYPLLLSGTAFPKSSIPTRGHVCYDWPPRAHGFTGVHAWAHIPHRQDKQWHAPTTAAPHSRASLPSPAYPTQALTATVPLRLHGSAIPTTPHRDSHTAHWPFPTAFSPLVMRF